MVLKQHCLCKQRRRDRRATVYPTVERREYLIGEERSNGIAEATVEAIFGNEAFAVVVGIKERFLLETLFSHSSFLPRL